MQILFCMLILSSIIVLTAGLAAADDGFELYSYWPVFQRPDTILHVDEVPTIEEGILLHCLAGLAAKSQDNRPVREMIWYPIPSQSYDRWYKMLLKQTRAAQTKPRSIWSLVEHFKNKGVVEGYIIYKYDDSQRGMCRPGASEESLNVATSLCGPLKAVAITENLAAKAEKCGLKLILDARGKTSEWCFQEYKNVFNRKILGLQDPKAQNIRDYAVASDAFVIAECGTLYEKVLQWLEPPAPMLGWGIGDEAHMTVPSSEWGHFQTATNWCNNLPVFATEKAGDTIPRERLKLRHRKCVWDLEWEDDVHYASFLMSDGDNVQWLMGGFTDDYRQLWWNDSNRGSFAMGWTCCYMDLVQLCPYAMEYLIESSTSNDDLILYGGGYYYPELFGKKRGGLDTLKLHVSRVAEYMKFADMRTLALITHTWDNKDAIDSYKVYADTVPDLNGLLTVQYWPYSGGQGKVIWIENNKNENIPVVSARFAIWEDSDRKNEGTPSMVADMINAMPHEGRVDNEDRFSWVSVHAWSNFKMKDAGETLRREDLNDSNKQPNRTFCGLTPVSWCADRLASHVRLITPTEMLLQMRLRLKTKETLRGAVKELNEIVSNAPQGEKQRRARDLFYQANQAYKQGNYSECFQKGKAAYDTVKAE